MTSRSVVEVKYNNKKIHIYIYKRNLVSAGNTFQGLPRLRETADNTERFI